jgi:hypothetical protein
MATKKKGILSASVEWAKHLRRYGKKLFWNKEKQAAKKDIQKRLLKDGG